MGTTATYHITKRGEPGICRATVRCPLGAKAEHYDSPEAAQKAYERSMRGMAIPEAQNAYQRSKALRSRKEEFRAKLDLLKASLEPKARNWGQLQEFHLGLRSLLNDLEDLDVAKVTMGDLTFRRENGRIFEGEREIGLEAQQLDDLHDALNRKDRHRVQEALSSISKTLGFDGGIPVAGSSEKIDLRIETVDGYEFRASVKAFTGGNPSLQDPAKASYASFRTKIPVVLQPQVQAILDEPGKTFRARAQAIEDLGITFDPTNFGLDHKFRAHLTEQCGEEASSAYAQMLHSRLTGRERIVNADARNSILGAYATAMTNTSAQTDRANVANTMLEMHKDGSVSLYASEDPRAIGEHLADRIRVDNASAFESQFRLVNGVLQAKVYASFRIKPAAAQPR